jgi:hypothetical protein
MKLHHAILGLALAVMPAFAQSHFEANGSLFYGLDDLKKMTRPGNPAGYALGGAFRWNADGPVDHRLHLEVFSIRGKDGSGLQGNAPRHFSGGWDLVFQKAQTWSFFGGITATEWRQDMDKVSLAQYSDANFKNNEGKGTKLGGRLGIEYGFNQHWKATLTFNQTEFNKTLNPAWLSLGATYRF